MLFIDSGSNVAIATLWTKKEVVAARLEAAGLLEKVRAIGTLYTVYGVNYLLHTLAENPEITVLLVFGADLSGSGEALLKLFNGREVPEGLQLMWPLEALEQLLSDVSVVDLRAAYAGGRWSELFKAVERYYSPAPPRRQPLRLELSERVVDSWPLPVSGLLVQESSLLRAWVKAVYAVMALGSLKGSEYGERQKQLLNLAVALGFYGRRVELEEGLLRRIPRSEFERHLHSLLDPERPEGVAYTYGERLRRHPEGGDQLSTILGRLKSTPDTRRAVAVLWDHAVDQGSREPPCILVVQGDLTSGYYNHTVYMRSNDVYAAWPLNAYAQARLAELVASELGVKLGSVTLVSCSAHIYEHDWERAWGLVHDHYESLSSFTPDPRGSVLVGLERVEHRAPDGRPALEYSLQYRDLKRLALLLAPDHAFYLGWEARRALERALRGEPYRQDEEEG